MITTTWNCESAGFAAAMNQNAYITKQTESNEPLLLTSRRHEAAKARSVTGVRKGSSATFPTFSANSFSRGRDRRGSETPFSDANRSSCFRRCVRRACARAVLFLAKKPHYISQVRKIYLVKETLYLRARAATWLIKNPFGK